MKAGNYNILTINAGSSSIRFAVYSTGESLKKLLSGQIKRIGLKNTEFTFKDLVSGEKNSVAVHVSGFNEAAEFLLDWLKKQQSLSQVSCIGHRVVHGRDYTSPEIIDDALLTELSNISEFDPSHLPSEIAIIKLFKEQLPHLLQVACFDTSFHTTMPRVAKILPIPRDFDKAGIRRYGFHGLSYTYLMEALKNVNGENKTAGKIILAHLGNGASLTAVKAGKSLDTSMGFTPASGLVMSTRPGDLDPGVAWYMMQSNQMTPEKFNHLINQEAGLLGVSESSSDMQDLLEKENFDVRAAEAVNLFCYQVKKWIGAFAAVLNGLDTLVLSGGIGENAPVIRSRICEGLSYLGIEIDEEENHRTATAISKQNSPVNVYVIPTDEEIVIAKATRDLYIKSEKK